MVLPDVRCIVPVCGAIASLAAVILSLPSSAIAVPAPPPLAYYKPTINAYELYVRPLWFGPLAPDNEAEPALMPDPMDDLEPIEADSATPSLRPITQPENSSESRS